MKYCTCVTSRHSVTIADLNEAIARQSFDSYDACHDYFVKKVLPSVDDDDYGIFALNKDGKWYRVLGGDYRKIQIVRR